MGTSDDLEPIVSPPAGVRRPWKRMLGRAGAGLLVAALVIGVVAVVTRDSTGSPDDQLEAVRSFLDEAETAQFQTTMTMTFGSGLGQTITQKMRGDGDIAMPDQAVWRLNAGDFRSEVVVTSDGYYDRTAEEDEKLSDQRWTFTPAEEGDEDAGADPEDDPGFLHDFSSASTAMGALHPSGLRRVVDRLRDPERIDGDTIRATVGVADVFEPEDAEGKDGTLTVTLTSGSGGRLDRVLWALDIESTDKSDPGKLYYDFDAFSMDVDVTFSSWGEPVTITVPDQADTDEAEDEDYGVEKQELRAYRDAPLVGPRDLPTGWRLTAGWVENPTDDDGNEIDPAPGCAEVYLEYMDPVAYQAWADSEDDDGPYPPELRLYLSSVDCDREDEDDVDGWEPYTAGTFSGRISRPAPGVEATGECGYTDAFLTVGKTLVEATSDLCEPALTKALASLAPLDLDDTLEGVKNQEVPTLGFRPGTSRSAHRGDRPTRRP